MKLTKEQAIAIFGAAVVKSVEEYRLAPEATNRVLGPVYDAEHAGLVEYASTDEAPIKAYYYLTPEEVERVAVGIYDNWHVDHFEALVRHYMYKGQQVGIVRNDELPENISSSVLDYAGHYSIVPLTIMQANGLESELTFTDDMYGLDNSRGDDIDTGMMVNPENEQKLIQVIDTVLNLEEDEYNRNYHVITNRYYDWTSEAEKMCCRITDVREETNPEEFHLKMQELEAQWREVTSNPPTTLCEAFTFEELLKKTV